MEAPSGVSEDDELRPIHDTSVQTPLSLRSVAVDFTVCLVWASLVTINLPLHALTVAYRLLENCMCALSSQDASRHVVVVGASFGGLAAQRQLSGRRDVKVILVDFKNYFEYTPGILRCFVQPSYLSQLTCPLPASRNELLTGTMCGATEEYVVVQNSHGVKQQVRFDYLVLAVGSTYSDPIKPTASEPSLAERSVSWRKAAAELDAANAVIIVGAGAVGVELAGEILTAYPKKRITLVDVATAILPGFDQTASSYAYAWLEKRGAQLRLGEAIELISKKSLLLKSGEEIEADVVYKCTGMMPNTAMLADSPFASSFGFRDSVEVNGRLQVDGHPHVYCVGDMMSHSSRELKLGHTAEVNAHLAAHNILADLHRKPLLTYPNGITGADSTPKIYCLSLGKYDAIMGFNELVLCGWYVAVLKWLLEWSKVAAAGERPIGVIFWRVADGMSMWLGRTFLGSPSARFEALSKCADLGTLILRIVTAVLIFHHGLDKLENTDTFSNKVIAVYFSFLPGPPVFWTYLSAGFEIVGSFCIAAGILTRPAAALLAATMVNAIAFHLMKFGRQSFPFNPPNRGAYTFEPSLAFLGATAYICLAGPGRFAIQPHFPNLSFLANPVCGDLGMLILRVVTALLIVHHGLDKLENVDAFSSGVIAIYFRFLPGPPIIWTYLSASFEIIGSFCITFGIFVRPAAALLGATMVNAIAFHLMKFGPQSFPLNPAKGGAYTFEPSLAFLGANVCICLVGPQRFAVWPNRNYATPDQMPGGARELTSMGVPEATAVGRKHA